MFNIQGSSWSRSRRQFVIHDKQPPSLQTAVKPADIPLFSTSQASSQDCSTPEQSSPAASTSNGSSGASSSISSSHFAVYCNSTDDLTLLGLHEELSVSIQGQHPHVIFRTASSHALGTYCRSCLMYQLSCFLMLTAQVWLMMWQCGVLSKRSFQYACVLCVIRLMKGI